MTEKIFPTLRGLEWSVLRSPTFAVRKQKSVSGRELLLIDQILPVWEWTLTYSLLRDTHDRRQTVGPLDNYDELRTLVGFFIGQQSSFIPFLFDDPTDDYVAGEPIGTGDGATLNFQLTRTMTGGYAEPITAPNNVEAVFLNGDVADPTTYVVDAMTGLVSFTTAPDAGVSVSADFSYYFRVRFSDDTTEFENFMVQLWSAKQIKFKSMLLPPVSNFGGLTVQSLFNINWQYVDLPPTAGNFVLIYTFGQVAAFPPNFASSQATAQVPATVDTIFDISKNAVNFATMTFAASNPVASFSGSAMNFTQGDVLIIVPRRSDATLASLAGVFVPSG